MTLAQLDAIFPYVCFGYGAVMTLVLGSSTLMKLADRIADERVGQDWAREWIARFKGHRALALVCLFVGAIWILQNLWLA